MKLKDFIPKTRKDFMIVAFVLLVTVSGVVAYRFIMADACLSCWYNLNEK